MKTVTEKVHKKLCKILENTKSTKKELRATLELIYQEWEYIRRGW